MEGDELAPSGPVLIEILRDVLGKGVRCRFMAKGFSMSPFIRDEDMVTVSPLSGTSPRTGDVVAFVHSGTGRLLVHRVVGKRNGTYLAKGDNTGETDGWFPKSEILGRVTRVERNGKEVFLGLGLERLLIAFLTRKGLLIPLLFPVRQFLRNIH